MDEPSLTLNRNDQRKAKRWANGAVLQLVPLDACKPWPKGCRSAWFVEHVCLIERQRLLLAAAIAKGMELMVSGIRAALAETRRLRDAGCPAMVLFVDELIAALGAVPSDQ